MHADAQTTDRSACAALFHRWFVQYNPLYLASATLVLGGLWLLARAVSSSASVRAILGVGAIAELYAIALIGAAACIFRLGQRRAAGMLGLLAIVYQGDPMLRLESAAFLGAVGIAMSCAWAVLFVAKLAALARALELRLSRSALVVPATGAVVIAALPHVLRDLPVAARTTPVALAFFAIGALAVWTRREVRSVTDYDVRAVRSVRAAWALLTALGAGHVLYLAATMGVELAPLGIAALLLTTRFVPSERHVWALVATALGAGLVMVPGWLGEIAAMTAVVLLLRGWRTEAAALPVERPRTLSPYRGGAPPEPLAMPAPRFERADAPAITRLVTGALAAAHLACWTAGTGASPWPEHVLALDALATLAAAWIAWRRRSPVPAAPLTLLHAHLAREMGLVPSTPLAWGASSVGAGFALLLLAVAVSARAARASEPRAE